VTRRLTRELAALGSRVHVFGVQGVTGALEVDAAMTWALEVDAARIERTAGVEEGGFYFSGLRHFVDARAADVVVLYNDPVVIRGYLDALGGGPSAGGSDRVKSGAARVYVYLDLVYDSPLEVHWSTVAHPLVAGIMVMSECWKRELAKWPVRLAPVMVVPHAADVAIVPDARRSLGWDAPTTTPSEIGKDAVVFANLNRNTPRKRLDLYATAAVRVLARNVKDERCVDAVFLASSTLDSTFDLHSVARRELVGLGVPPECHVDILDRIRINRVVLSDAVVAAVHNACDVAVNCAEGEGFGLVPLEAASVGKAVIVSGVGGMLDVFSPRVPTGPPPAVVVPTSAEYFLDSSRDGIGGRARVVDVEDLAKAMEFFLCRENREGYGGRARDLVRAMPTWADIARTVHSFMGCDARGHEAGGHEAGGHEAGGKRQNGDDVVRTTSRR
jgi:glycosyltransferase involved in cell wall biosynthesis